MIEVEEPEVPETPNPVVLRRCTVLDRETDAIDSSYPVGLFESTDSAGGTHTVAIILIGEVEGRLAVVVPTAAWHRNLARRQLPNGALLKPVRATLAFLDRVADPDGAPQSREVWLGLLAAPFEGHVLFDLQDETFEPDLPFDSASPSFLPTAQSLVELFDHQFTVSATSGLEPSGQATPLPDSALDRRLQRLEDSVDRLVSNFKHLSGEAPPGLSRPPALKNPGPCSDAPRVQFAATAHADPDVVQSARNAGIPEEQIAEMARLATRGQSHLSDFPLPKANPKPKSVRSKNVLSESEDEEEEAELEPDVQEGEVEPLVQAVTKLTEIAGHLTKQKKKDTSLESLLDGCGPSGSADVGSGSGRKYAAALRALRRTLMKKPSEISKAIERNMEEDFNVRTQLPGANPVPVTSRAWLEMRSRIQGFVTPVKMLWSVAGALDALRAGNQDECRARLNLLLAAGDQMSIDRGSWVVAGEILLEEPPPMSIFQNHVLPSEGEAPYTRLIDARWFEIFLQKLQDYDALTEKKKKLSLKKFQKPDASPPVETPDPKPKPKAKTKGKGKGKGESSGGGAAEAAQEMQWVSTA